MYFCFGNAELRQVNSFVMAIGNQFEYLLLKRFEWDKIAIKHREIVEKKL